MLSGFLTAITAIGALAAVLALIWLASCAARMGGWAPRKPGGHCLAVRDAIVLDSRRRLHLVRCDGHDVLLLTGGVQDVVVGQWSVVDNRGQDGGPRVDGT